jgi:hypothetical protein
MVYGIDLKGELKSCLTQNPRDVVIVVGAGVTIGALRGSPFAEVTSWQGLLRAGLEHAGRLGRWGAAELAELQACLASEAPQRWIEAAEQITRALGGPEGGELRAWLRATVGAFPGEIRDSGALEALRDLHRRGALLATVNYDGLLEAVTGERPVTWRDPARVERVIRGHEGGILHLHGYWEEPASLVFGTHSYEEVASDAHARAVLQALRMTRTLVFVGHGAGLRDPNWGSLLEWMEQVFARSEFRHYRLVREDERERVQAEHKPEQRIEPLVYGPRHEDLAPFLRSLVPAEAREAARAESRTKTVVLRLNIGEDGFDWLSEEAIRAQVRRVFEDPEPVMLPEVRRHVNRQAISPREWRAIALELDRLRDKAQAAVPAGEPVRYVVAGQAPLPAFAYLGRLMARMGPITTFNRRQGSGEWDVIGPLDGVEPGEDLFERKEPERGREQHGTVVLSIQCSNEYPYKEEMIEPILRAEGRHLLCSYEIANATSHQRRAMGAPELVALLDHVRAALAWMKERCPQMDGLTVAFGGPSWVAFWIGQALYTYALAPRLDFPNLVAKDGRRYVRAMSSPMHKAPWLAGKAKLLFVGAEPNNAARTRGAKAVEVIEEAFERELGRQSETYDLRMLGAATVAKFQRELDIFQPDILHLHLHGSSEGEGGLVLEDVRGEAKLVPFEAVVELIRSSECRPTLVVLSACHSAAMAPALDGVAECAVFMTGEVRYATAIDFASSFYGALSRGRSIPAAICQGKSRILGDYGKAENEQIGWWCAQGVNAEDVVLLPDLHARRR